MISTFLSISACWVHHHGEKVVDTRGDAFYVLRYPPITTYKIISNRKANGTCFLDFTIETPKSPQLNFFENNRQTTNNNKPKYTAKRLPHLFLFTGY